MNLTRSTIHEPYSDSEFENYFVSLEKEQLLLAEINAKHDGSLGDPSTQRHYFIRIITPLKNIIQKAIDFNYGKFQPVSNVARIQDLRTTAGSKIFELTKEKNDKDTKRRLLKNEQKGLKAKLNSSISSKLRRIIPAVFGICEGYIVYNMLQNTKLPTIVSFFWGLLTALVTAFGLFLSANFICKAKTIFQKRIRIAIVLAAAFGVALSLGVWRANTYNEISSFHSRIDLNQATENSSSFSPWPFVMLSFVSFLVALAFEIKFWISDEERKRLRLYEEKSDEVKKADQEYNTIQKEIDSISKNMASDSGLAMEKYEYASGNEKRLITLAHQVVSIYEATNVNFRKDNICPEFFGNRIGFGFTLYFTGIFNVKNTNHEKSNGTPHHTVHDELMPE